MPLYDYECPSCGAQQEVQHSMSEIGKISVSCDQCDHQMKKMLSAPTLLGFDDVGRSIGKKDKANKSKPNTADSKSAAKSSGNKKVA